MLQNESESVCSSVLCFRLLLVSSDFVNFLLVDRSEIGWGMHGYKQVCQKEKKRRKEERKNIDVFHNSIVCLYLLEEWIFIKKRLERFVIVNCALIDIF